jgi:hypothetical protein
MLAFEENSFCWQLNFKELIYFIPLVKKEKKNYSITISKHN